MHFTSILSTFALLAPVLLASPTPRTRAPRAPNPAPHNSRHVPSPPYCPPKPASEAQQRELFFDFVYDLYTLKNATLAFETYVAVDLIEHDPFDAQGRAPNEAKLNGILPYASFDVLRYNFDSNIGLIHVRVNEEPEPIALADIYRMDGTCIVEHWDVTQARPANATNPIAMF